MVVFEMDWREDKRQKIIIINKKLKNLSKKKKNLECFFKHPLKV